MNRKKLIKKMATLKRYRNFQIRADSEEKEDRIRFAASSNTPVETFIFTEDFMGRGFEVLSHKEEDVDLERLRNGGHFLLDHKSTGVENNLGMIREADVDGERLNVEVEQNSHNPTADRVFKEMRSGFRPNVSIGFMRNDDSARMVGQKDGLPIFEFDFEPFEVSSVLIPADSSVGVGRSTEDLLFRELGLNKESKKDRELASEILREAGERPLGEFEDFEDCVNQNQDKDDPEAFCGSLQEEIEGNAVNEENIKTAILIDDDSTTRSESTSESDSQIQEHSMSDKNKNESQTVSVGPDLGKESGKVVRLLVDNGFEDLAPRAVEENWSEERAGAEMFKQARTKLEETNVEVRETYTEQEAKELDLSKALRNFVKGEDSEIAEAGRATAQKRGIDVRDRCIYVPIYAPILRRQSQRNLWKKAARAHSSLVAGDGGNIVGTEYLALADALFEMSLMDRLGVSVLSTTNLAQVPRWNTNTPVAWVGEDATSTLTSGSFALETVSPKMAQSLVPITPFLGVALEGTYQPIDRIFENIALALADAREIAFFQGSGSNQPVGLIHNPDITATAATSAAASGAIDAYGTLWQTIRDNNTDADGPFLVSPDVYRVGVENVKLSGGQDVAAIDPRAGGPWAGMTAYGPVQHTRFLGASGSAVYGRYRHAMAFDFGLIELRRDESNQLLNGRDVLVGRLFFDTVVEQPGAFSRASQSIA